MTSLLALVCVLLSGGVLAGERVGVEDIRISFANPLVAPLDGVPKAALNTGIGPDPDAAKDGSSGIRFGVVNDPSDQGALTNLVAGRISSLNVTWADLKFVKNESETRNFLRQLLSITNSHSWTFHVWSNPDGDPNVVATVEHTEGKQGKWYVWCSPSLVCAYLDGNGKWWWCSWPQRVPKPFAINLDAIPWGEKASGLQLASAVDEPNGVIHCWVRNGESDEVSYNDFDFGYWEFVGLEIRQGTNWVNLPRATPGSVCGGCHAAGKIKRLKAKQVITGADWLRYEVKSEYAGLIASADGMGWSTRLPASFFYEDTFSLDLMAFQTPPQAVSLPVEARVRQTFYPVSAGEMRITLYSPVFTLGKSAIQFFEPK